MENCSNCKKRLTHEDFEQRRCTDWEDVCSVCRELPEVKGRWAVLATQDKLRLDNLNKKLQHDDML